MRRCDDLIFWLLHGKHFEIRWAPSVFLVYLDRIPSCTRSTYAYIYSFDACWNRWRCDAPLSDLIRQRRPTIHMTGPVTHRRPLTERNYLRRQRLEIVVAAICAATRSAALGARCWDEDLAQRERLQRQRSRRSGDVARGGVRATPTPKVTGTSMNGWKNSVGSCWTNEGKTAQTAWIVREAHVRRRPSNHVRQPGQLARVQAFRRREPIEVDLVLTINQSTCRNGTGHVTDGRWWTT